MSNGYLTAREKQEETASKISSMNDSLRWMKEGTLEYEKLKTEKKILLQQYYDSFNKLKITIK